MRFLARVLIKLFIIWISEIFHVPLVKIYSKVTLKYYVSMLTSPSREIHFRIIRAMNPLSQLYINRKFQKYLSVSIYHCHRASLMNSLIIADKNGCHLVVRIGSPALISFYCVCVVSFYFFFFSYFFCGVYFLLRY